SRATVGSAVPRTVESRAATNSDSISPAMTRTRSPVQLRRVIAGELTRSGYRQLLLQRLEEERVVQAHQRESDGAAADGGQREDVKGDSAGALGAHPAQRQEDRCRPRQHQGELHKNEHHQSAFVDDCGADGHRLNGAACSSHRGGEYVSGLDRSELSDPDYAQSIPGNQLYRPC